MTILYTIIFYLLISGIVSGFIFGVGFRKAGRNPLLAFIPIYGTIVQMQIIRRPWWWTILFWIPIVNNIMIVVLLFEWLRLFGYHKKRYVLISLLTLGLFVIYASYRGTYNSERVPIREKSLTGWIGSIMFAIVAATIVHTYLIQPFIIPTSSLEKTLLVGDFLFVSKFHYGARLPMTPLSFPMVHDTIPVIKTKSYIKTWQLPYIRLPRLQKIKHNDIVVFSWPNDTVIRFHDRSSKIHADKPIDKKSNYVKRCTGLPGDTLSVVNGYVHINGQKNILSSRARLEFAYFVHMKKGQSLSENYMYKRFDVTESFYKIKENTYVFPALDTKAVEALKKNPKVKSIERYLNPKGKYSPDIFPHFPEMPWNVSNYGPMYIPKKGTSVHLTMTNLPLYKRIIQTYEGHQLEAEGLEIKIDGKRADTYTFAQNYYWMMGDNRDRSDDSRYWGFVPEDHIVGKAIFVWMSIDWSHGFKVRWDRIFTTVSGSGEPVSYFKYFVIVMIIGFIARFFIRKRKSKS